MRKKRTKGWIGVLLTAKKRAGACLLAGALLMMPAGCSTAQEPSEVQSILVEGQELAWLRSMDRKYAEEFSIDYYEGGYAWITIADSEHFLLVPEGGTVPDNPGKDVAVLKQPVENIYLSASAVMDMFVSMDGMDRLRFSSLREDGWYIPEAKKAMETGKLLYAGKYAAPDYERILAEGCGLAIENTMIYHAPQVKEQLERLGIPVLVDHSSYEREPLGRTEWIRLYGLLAGREKEAEAAFFAQAEAFEWVKAQVKENGQGKKAQVAFFYITSNGEVNIRKPSDYLPRMIELAGGSYVFPGEDDGSRASAMTIQMEEFYAQAKEADYLIYNSTVDGELQGLEDLLEKEGILKNFKAVEEGRVFCTTKDLYQSSMALGTIIFDLHEMLEGREENLTYFYRLDSHGQQAADDVHRVPLDRCFFGAGEPCSAGYTQRAPFNTCFFEAGHWEHSIWKIKHTGTGCF